MERRRFLAGAGGVAVAVGLPLAGCLEDDDEYDVGMTATEYVPQEITVDVGDTVVWRNTSTRAHTVTAYEGGIPEEAAYFASGGYDDEPTAREEWWDDRGGAMDSGEAYQHTFEVPGRYDYVCVPHEDGAMIGAVIVEA